MKVNLRTLGYYVLVTALMLSCTLLIHTSNSLAKAFIVLCIVIMFLVGVSKGTLARVNLLTIAWFAFCILSMTSGLWAYRTINYKIVIVLFLIGFVSHGICIVIEEYTDLLVFFEMTIFSGIMLELYLVSYYGMNMLSMRMDNDILNSNQAGMIFTYALFLTVYMFIVKRKVRYLIEGGILLGGVLLSGSKTAILASIVLVGIFLMLKDSNDYLKTFRNIIIIIIGVVVVANLMLRVEALYNIIGKRLFGFLAILTGAENRSTSTELREMFIGIGISLFKQHPIAGVGLDNFRYFNAYGTYAHSNVVEVLADLGIVGFICFYSMYFVIIKRVFRNPHISKICKSLVYAFLLNTVLINFSDIYYNEMFDIIMIILIYKYILVDEKGTFSQAMSP